MKLTIRDGVYYVDYRAPDGRRMRPSTGIRVAHADAPASVRAEAEAKAYEAAGNIVKAAMMKTEAAEPSVSFRPTLGTLLSQRYEQHWKRLAYGTTMKYTISKLCRLIGHWHVDKITSKMIRDVYEQMQKEGTQVSTINRYTNALKSTMRQAVTDKLIEEELIPEFPTFSEKRLVRERYMYDHEETAILGYMTRMQCDDLAERRWEWDYMAHLFVFLTDTGFRFSEAFKFTLVDGHADLEHGCTKNTIGRRIKLTKRALYAAQFLLGCSHHADLERQARVKPKAAWDWCNHRFEKALKVLNINTATTVRRARLTMHCLRHTCASRLLARGINIVVVSKWLGHSNIKVTMRYLKLEKNAFADAAAALEPIDLPGEINADRQTVRGDEAGSVGEVRDERQQSGAGVHHTRGIREGH